MDKKCYKCQINVIIIFFFQHSEKSSEFQLWLDGEWYPLWRKILYRPPPNLPPSLPSSLLNKNNHRFVSHSLLYISYILAISCKSATSSIRGMEEGCIWFRFYEATPRPSFPQKYIIFRINCSYIHGNFIIIENTLLWLPWASLCGVTGGSNPPHFLKWGGI